MKLESWVSNKADRKKLGNWLFFTEFINKIITDFNKSKFNRSNGIEMLIRMFKYNLGRRSGGRWIQATLSKSFTKQESSGRENYMNKMRVPEW